MTNFGTNLTYAIPNIISILACLWLFKRYVGTFSPPLELKMVTALGASNFAFHFATFFIIWTTTTFFPTISSIAIIFSISWALHMSYLTHKAARNGTVPNSHRYSSLINLLLPSLVLAFGWKFIESKLNLAKVTQILLIIAVVLIIILYTKTLHGIANYVIPLRKALKVKIKTLAMIPLVQVVMLGLVLYNNAILILTLSPSLIISPTIAAIISGLTGAANVAVYLMQNGATAPGSPDTTAAFL